MAWLSTGRSFKTRCRASFQSRFRLLVTSLDSLPFSVCTSIPGAVRHCHRTKLRNDERKGNSFDRQTSGETSSYNETRKKPCFVEAVRLDGERKISVSPASTNAISREKLVFSLETVVKRKPRACSSSSPVTWIVSYRIPI